MPSRTSLASVGCSSAASCLPGRPPSQSCRWTSARSDSARSTWRSGIHGQQPVQPLDPGHSRPLSPLSRPDALARLRCPCTLGYLEHCADRHRRHVNPHRDSRRPDLCRPWYGELGSLDHLRTRGSDGLLRPSPLRESGRDLAGGPDPRGSDPADPGRHGVRPGRSRDRRGLPAPGPIRGQNRRRDRPGGRLRRNYIGGTLHVTTGTGRLLDGLAARRLRHGSLVLPPLGPRSLAS
jgi:hypothetical protein